MRRPAGGRAAGRAGCWEAPGWLCGGVEGARVSARARARVSFFLPVPLFPGRPVAPLWPHFFALAPRTPFKHLVSVRPRLRARQDEAARRALWAAGPTRGQSSRRARTQTRAPARRRRRRPRGWCCCCCRRSTKGWPGRWRPRSRRRGPGVTWMQAQSERRPMGGGRRVVFVFWPFEAGAPSPRASRGARAMQGRIHTRAQRTWRARWAGLVRAAAMQRERERESCCLSECGSGLFTLSPSRLRRVHKKRKTHAHKLNTQNAGRPRIPAGDGHAPDQAVSVQADTRDGSMAGARAARGRRAPRLAAPSRRRALSRVVHRRWA